MSNLLVQEFTNTTNAQGEFVLPQLKYSYDSVADYIDAETMEIHHTKHHQTYITKLNAALVNHADLRTQSAEALLLNLNNLPSEVQGAVRNHGGGHANHCLFWEVIAPHSGQCSKDLTNAIDNSFGNLENCLTELNNCAISVFGSGWAWLAVDQQKNLKILGTPNQDSPLSQGLLPIFGIDVWEHAYYLRYQNRRPDYISSVLKHINWDNVSARFHTVQK